MVMLNDHSIVLNKSAYLKIIVISDNKATCFNA